MLACFIKPAGEDGSTPMKRSRKQITQDNLRASISSYFGIELIENGRHTRTVEEIGEDENVTRYFWMNGTNDIKTNRDYNLVTYEITGDANDFSNWKNVSEERIKYPYYDAAKDDKKIDIKSIILVCAVIILIMAAGVVIATIIIKKKNSKRR